MSALGRLDYSIDSARITSSTGEVKEFKDLIAGIDVYESLLSPYIKVELTIVDSANLLESMPIIGQEKIQLTILEGNTAIRRTFYIGGVSNFIKANNQAAMYVLKLITPEQMLNSLLLVSQSFTGTIDSSIEKIVKDYLQSKISVKDKSIGNYTVVIPNWNPFQAIDWLARRGINNNKMPFAFYETWKDGFMFESYESMFKKKTYNRFVHKGGTTADNDADNQAASYNVAFDYDLRDFANTYKNTLRGTFGAGMWVVDIATKSYKFLTYDYEKDFKKKKHLDQREFLNPDFKVAGRKISEFAAVHHTVNKNSKAFGKNPVNNYNNEVEFTKLETDPFVYQLTLNKINMSVRGRVDLCPGKIIEFAIDRTKPTVYGNTTDENVYLSGRYLVLNTHHKMSSGKFVTVLDVVRDSLGKKVKKVE
jgi:hypothetical protein